MRYARQAFSAGANSPLPLDKPPSPSEHTPFHPGSFDKKLRIRWPPHGRAMHGDPLNLIQITLA